MAGHWCGHYEVLRRRPPFIPEYRPWPVAAADARDGRGEVARARSSRYRTLPIVPYRLFEGLGYLKIFINTQFWHNRYL